MDFPDFIFHNEEYPRIVLGLGFKIDDTAGGYSVPRRFERWDKSDILYRIATIEVENNGQRPAILRDFVSIELSVDLTGSALNYELNRGEVIVL